MYTRSLVVGVKPDVTRKADESQVAGLLAGGHLPAGLFQKGCKKCQILIK